MLKQVFLAGSVADNNDFVPLGSLSFVRVRFSAPSGSCKGLTNILDAQPPEEHRWLPRRLTQPQLCSSLKT